MITLTAQIGSLPKNVSIGATGNNQSATSSALIGAKSSNLNPFMLGVSKFEDNGKFSNGVPFFVGNEPIGTNSVLLMIEYYGEEQSGSFEIIFDTYNNQYPQSIYINKVGTIENTSNHFYLNDIEKSVAYLMILKDWTLPNYPIRIESISSGLNIAIDRHNKISYNGSITDRADHKLPSWGIISNVGNLEFNDTDSSILWYANQNSLVQGINAKIYLEDTLSGKKEQIADFLTDTWNYDNDNRQVSVSLKDDLEEWQDIYVEGFDYDPRNPKSKIASQFYNYIWEKTPQKYKMKPYSSLDDRTRYILSLTEIKYPFLKSGTLWQQWTKLCQLCALHIYKNSQGETTCVHDNEG